MLNGTRIIESVYLTEAGEPREVRRSWTERLCSWPWRPFRATRTIIPQVPMKGGYRLADGSLVMHPETVRALKALASFPTPTGRAEGDEGPT